MATTLSRTSPALGGATCSVVKRDVAAACIELIEGCLYLNCLNGQWLVGLPCDCGFALQITQGNEFLSVQFEYATPVGKAGAYLDDLACGCHFVESINAGGTRIRSVPLECEVGDGSSSLSVEETRRNETMAAFKEKSCAKTFDGKQMVGQISREGV